MGRVFNIGWVGGGGVACVGCIAKDAREQRPLHYPGRVLTASKNAEQTTSFWKKSHIMTDGRTAPAIQLPARDMELIDNCNPSSLPTSTDEGQLVHGANKYSQIGLDAATKTLELMLAGS